MRQVITAVLANEVTQEKTGLAGQYLQFCAGRLDQLGKYITQHDLVSVIRIAHALRGNASRIGLSELSSLGRQLEEYCAGKDWSAINSTYRAISDTVYKLCAGRQLHVEVEYKPTRHTKNLSIRKAS